MLGETVLARLPATVHEDHTEPRTAGGYLRVRKPLVSDPRQRRIDCWRGGGVPFHDDLRERGPAQPLQRAVGEPHADGHPLRGGEAHRDVRDSHREEAQGVQL
jgi:hypothetical protein